MEFHSIYLFVALFHSALLSVLIHEHEHFSTSKSEQCWLAPFPHSITCSVDTGCQHILATVAAAADTSSHSHLVPAFTAKCLPGDSRARASQLRQGREEGGSTLSHGA